MDHCTLQKFRVNVALCPFDVSSCMENWFCPSPSWFIFHKKNLHLWLSWIISAFMKWGDNANFPFLYQAFHTGGQTDKKAETMPKPFILLHFICPASAAALFTSGVSSCHLRTVLWWRPLLETLWFCIRIRLVMSPNKRHHTLCVTDFFFNQSNRLISCSALWTLWARSAGCLHFRSRFISNCWWNTEFGRYWS